MTPVALFGLSGVGKTTLAHGLTNLDHQTFFIASITTSRSPRADDDPRYIEFVSEIDFISSIAQKCFALSWKQDGNYYGYRYEYLKNRQLHPILTCSLSAIQKLKEYKAITVLVIGDSVKGLQARGCKEDIKKRAKLNDKNTILYINQPWFKKSVDIEHKQIWGDIPTSVQALYYKINTFITNISN